MADVRLSSLPSIWPNFSGFYQPERKHVTPLLIDLQWVLMSSCRVCTVFAELRPILLRTVPLRNTFSCCRNSSYHHPWCYNALSCLFSPSPDQMLHFWLILQANSKMWPRAQMVCTSMELFLIHLPFYTLMVERPCSLTQPTKGN